MPPTPLLHLFCFLRLPASACSASCLILSRALSLALARSVGYGASPDDISAIPDWFRPYVTAHVLLSTSLFGALISYAASLRGSRLASLRQQNIGQLKLTESLIAELDRNGDGVDKLEFVIGMLVKLDLAYFHDIQPLLKLFDQFDSDRSGVLTRDDIVLQLKGGVGGGRGGGGGGGGSGGSGGGGVAASEPWATENGLAAAANGRHASSSAHAHVSSQHVVGHVLSPTGPMTDTSKRSDLLLDAASISRQLSHSPATGTTTTASRSTWKSSLPQTTYRL